MEIIKNGEDIFNSDKLSDYFISEVISGSFIKDKEYKGLNPKFQELIHGEIYSKTGEFHYEVQINGVIFDSVELDVMFRRMFEFIEGKLSSKYSNIENEIEERVKAKIETFLDKVAEIKSETLYN